MTLVDALECPSSAQLERALKDMDGNFGNISVTLKRLNELLGAIDGQLIVINLYAAEMRSGGMLPDRLLPQLHGAKEKAAEGIIGVCKACGSLGSILEKTSTLRNV